MPANPIFLKKIAVYSSLFFIIAVLFAFTLYAYPVMGGDSIYYTATAINHKLGHGLVNQLSPMFLVGDPSGAGRFLVFPPLYPLLLSALMPEGTPQAAYMAMFVIYTLTIFIAAYIYRKLIIPDWQKASWYRIAIFSFSLFSLAAVTIFYPGRPETLIRLLVIVALFGFLHPQKKWLSLLLGAIFGLIIATHPGPAILFGPLIGVFFALYRPSEKAIKLTFLSFIVALFIFFMVTELFGYGFLETTRGVFNQFFRLNSGLSPTEYITGDQPSVISNQFSLNKESFLRVLMNLTVSRNAPFQGLIITSSIICLLFFYRRSKNKIAGQVGLYLFGLVAFAFLFTLLVQKQNLSYVFALSPLWILIVAYYAANLANVKILKFAALAVIMLSSMTFFHRLALFPFFLKSGMPLERARATFEQLSLDTNERIGVDGTIWPISENYNQMYLWGHSEDVEYPTTTIIMREGLNGWTELPSKWSYCRKKNDFSTGKKPEIFDLPLANAIPGYAFSVYDCSSATKEKNLNL